ncbi:hypothetical protein Cni_G01166 [Canna indica]|uniref:Uncharacterized protein n=1 Tax=Canna indica TaxID=4628 RepID=A0AAQ3PXT8_9LILI|nr:hypothetical protein Cni_G01166 [Canna indica]
MTKHKFIDHINDICSDDISSVYEEFSFETVWARAANPVAGMSEYSAGVAFSTLDCIWSCKVAFRSPILE